MLYSTTDGHTHEICQRLITLLEAAAHRVSVCPVAEAMERSPVPFDLVVIGASIRYGKHQPQLRQYIERYQPILAQKPSAFFSVNVVARKAGKNRPETNPYLQKFLRRVSWRPSLLAVFAGKIDYPNCHFVDRLMIRLILWITDGPTDPKAVVEFTDWRQVEEFGLALCRLASPATVVSAQS